MYTVTDDLVLPCTVTGSWPRPRWYDDSMWGKPLDTCMLNGRFREKFGDALATVISDQERAGLDIVTHGDLHCDDDMAGRSWHHYPLQRWAGFAGDHLQSEETVSPWLRDPPGTLLNEIYTGWRWPHVVDSIRHRPLDYPKIWRMAQSKTRRPVKFGTCCSQVMGLFLDIHTSKYTDGRQIIWDMAEAMNTELLALRDAGCRCIQIEEPTLHFWANTYGADSEEVKFMLEAFNREVQGLDDVELWIHTCWGNPNMQRVIDNDSYRASFELYMHACKGDVWTVEMTDRDFREIDLFGALKGRLPKKVCIGAVSHRSLQVDSPEEVAGRIRRALEHVDPKQLIISSDCGFGRQGGNRDIAFFKSTALAQGCNIVRRELGAPETYVPAADPALQTDIVPKTSAGGYRRERLGAEDE
jgi:5-methyltetrahydropteroyltriglutamate--homocysteine methyltransferase